MSETVAIGSVIEFRFGLLRLSYIAGAIASIFVLFPFLVERRAIFLRLRNTPGDYSQQPFPR